MIVRSAIFGQTVSKAVNVFSLLNDVFDPDNQCNREDLDSILEHRFLAGVLELKVSYTTGSIE